MKTHTRAFKRILIEAKKFREQNHELSHAKAVQRASELNPHLVEKHRQQLRLGLVEEPDDAPIQATERGVSTVKNAALEELRRKASEVREAEPELTEEQAMVRASHEHPELVRRYREESGFLQTSAP